MISTKIVFDRHGRASGDMPATVDIRITIDRKTYYVGTGVRCTKNEWVAGAICNTPAADELNERIRIIYTKVVNITNELSKHGQKFSIAEVRRQVWNVADDMAKDNSLLEWIELQINHMPLAEGTLKHYRTVLTRLVEYKRIKSWHDLTVENIYMWDAWLHQLKVDGKPISDAAVYNYHKCLKSLLHRAVDFERIPNNPYDRLRGKIKRGDKESVEYLTEDEMQRFVDLVLPEGSKLQTAHDLFVFQMYTGLSYSDAMAFDRNDYMYDDASGTWRNNGTRIKTGTPYVSQLLPPVVDVLDRYGWQIPRIDNADYNHALKLLGEMAGIKAKMHSHLARHTFATFMLANGAKIENVSRMLGHTNITQTQRYAKVLAQSVHDDFDLIGRKLKTRSQS